MGGGSGRGMKRMALFGVLAAVLVACSPQPAAQATPAASETAATHPVSGLKIVPLKVTTAAGKTYDFKVEMADSTAAQSRGLMFRTALGPFEGMIFPSVPPAPRSFWMKNTPLPLDIIFVGTDGRILNIEPGVPYELQPVGSTGATSGVLELAGGRSAELGIKPGDKVAW